jgi:predicted phosphoribosyltransferase
MGAVELLAPETDETICLNIRSGSVFASADAYINWHDVTDEEVVGVLASSK